MHKTVDTTDCKWPAWFLKLGSSFLATKGDVRADHRMPICALEKYLIEQSLMAPEEKDLWESFLRDPVAPRQKALS